MDWTSGKVPSNCMNVEIPMRTVAEYVQIAFAGGGLTLDAAKFTTPGLIQIAFAASNKGARILITSARLKTTPEIIQIAFAGKGCVSFED